MRTVKWAFFSYLAVVVLAIVGMGVAFSAAPPRDPGTYYVPHPGTIKTLDPAEANDVPGSVVLGYVFEALYNYRYGRVPYTVVPELASALPEVSADGLTMTIHVRPGVRYYDPEHAVWPDGVGPEVTAEDFVYSFKRVCDFNVASGNYGEFQGHFQGLDDWWAYTKAHKGTVDYDRPVAAFEARDRRTLVLRFTAPYPQMLYNLVNNACSPVSRQVVDHWGEEVRNHPVGTGAYALSDNQRDQRLVMTANPIYRGRPDVDGGTAVPDAERLPKIKRVQLDYFDEEMAQWLLFKQGLFDIDTIPKDAYRQAIGGGGDLTPDMAARGVVLRRSPAPDTNYIGFNMGDPTVGKNKPLRQAMSRAFDRRDFIAKFLNGRGVPAVGPIPSGFPTYDPDRVNPNTQFDLPGARRLMAEAVRVNGGPIPPLSILFREGNTLNRQMGEFYVEQMAQIGVTLKPEYRDFARWQEMVDARQTQLFDGGWDSDYPDEQDFFQLFYGPNEPDGGLDSVAYRNPAFDRLYERGTAMQDSPQRRAIYMQMSQIVEDDCPWLIINYTLAYDLSYDWVGHRVPMDYGHGFTQNYDLDQALRSGRLAGHGAGRGDRRTPPKAER